MAKSGIVEVNPHHFGVSVPDIEASVKWYEEMFGFAVAKRMEMGTGGKIVFVRRGDFYIEFFQMTGAQPLPDDRRFPQKDLMTHGWKHLSFVVKDAHKAAAALKERGVEVVMEGGEGARAMAFIRDNAGNLIELNQVGAP
jgi:methylmalonyl-CoA/ethylmalonyl-CoA epimerase